MNVPGFLYYHIIDNLSYWEGYPEIAYRTTYNEIYGKLLSGEYSLILMGPPHWTMLNSIVQAAVQAYPNITKNYCTVHVPYIQYFDRNPSTKAVLVWFVDPVQCQEFAVQMDAYYHTHWKEICDRSPYLIGLIRDAQRADQREPDGTLCESTGIDAVDLHTHVSMAFDSFTT